MDLCPHANKDYQGREAKFAMLVPSGRCWCPVVSANLTEIDHVPLTQNWFFT